MKVKPPKFIIFFALIAISLVSCKPQGNQPSTTLHIVSTTDVHGYALTASEKNLSYDRVANYVEWLEDSGDSVLLLDAGDYVQGSAITNFSLGASAIQAMNASGYDAAAVGNHEFDFGGNHLLQLQQQATFPMLSANVRYKDKNPFPSHISLEVNNMKVAIIGVSTPETYWKTAPGGIQDWDFLDPVETLKPLVGSLRKDHQLIIILAHLGNEGEYTSTDLANGVKGIDIILDGHDHTQTPAGRIVGNTQIFNSGYHGQALGHTTVTFTNGKVSKITSKALDVSAEELNADYMMHPNAANVQALLQDIQQETQVLLGEVLLSVPINLEGSRDYVRTQESNLGRLIADSFRQTTGAQLALMNGGGIRTSISAGEVTRGEIFSVLPFNNTVVTIEVTGEELKEALEHGLSLYPEANGGFPHVSGFTYTVNMDAPTGSRVKAIMIDQQPIDMQETYSLALLTFLATGGDGFNMLKKPITREFSTDSDVFIGYLQQANANTFSSITAPRSTNN